jgi:hypothetical protein
MIYVDTIAGWWLAYPSEKYESQLGRMIPYISIYYGKIKTCSKPPTRMIYVDTIVTLT